MGAAGPPRVRVPVEQWRSLGVPFARPRRSPRTAPGAAGRRHRLVHPPGRPRRRRASAAPRTPTSTRIAALAPDLVIANEEENRARRPRRAAGGGPEVLVTEVRTLPQAFRELERVLVDGCGLARPGWLDEAEAAWRRTYGASRRRRGAPSYRSGGGRGWCSGRDTFAGDVLARLGVDNVYAGHPSAIRGSRSRSCRPRAAGPGRAARRAVPLHGRGRPRGVPRPAARRSSAAATSPGTAPRWPRRHGCWARPCEQRAADQTPRTVRRRGGQPRRRPAATYRATASQAERVRARCAGPAPRRP